MRTVVDTHLHLPDMFELHFLDQDGTVLDDADLAIGTAVEILGSKARRHDGDHADQGRGHLDRGASAPSRQILTVVRGYEKAHRLQRARRTSTFINMNDSDIAQQVAREAGLDDRRQSTHSSTTHTHIAQVAQTDWDFLVAAGPRDRLRDRRRRRASSSSARRPAQPAGGSAARWPARWRRSPARSAWAATLTFKQNLITFLPRISAANITPDVEVRVWDPKTARVAVGTADAKTGTATIDGEDPAQLANSFTDGLLPLAAVAARAAADPGPAEARLRLHAEQQGLRRRRPAAGRRARPPTAPPTRWPRASPTTSPARSPRPRATPTATRASRPARRSTIAGVPKQFAGKWTVTNARHVFDPAEGGYRTRF